MTWTNYLLRSALTFTVVLLSSVCFGQEEAAVVQEGSAYVARLEKILPVSKGGTLTVDTELGPISVKAWDRDDVQVIIEKRADVFTEAEASALIEDYQIFVQTENGSVNIEAQSKSGRSLNSLRIIHRFSVPVVYNVDLKTEAGKISVSDLEGNVKALTSGGAIHVGQITNGSVDITTAGGGLGIAGIQNGNGTGKTSGGGIKVGDVTGNLSVNTSGGRITLGKIGGTLSAETAGGSIKIAQTGIEAVALTSGGSIKIGKADGSVKVRTAGGSISIGPSEGLVKASTAGGSINIASSGGDVEATTSGGNIKVNGSAGSLKANTRGGNIHIRGARGAIEAVTSGGGIDAELVESGESVDTHCNLETRGGNITIRLPENLSATLDAELEIRRKVSRDYQIYSDFPLKIDGAGSRLITATGKINGGGDLIKLNTTNGDIRIRKLEK